MPLLMSAGLCLVLLLVSASAAPSALYYKLSGADITNSSAAWPAAFEKYDVLVADPGLSADQLAMVRRDLPGRKLVAYTCMSWAYVTQPCSNCSLDGGAKCSGCPGSRCVDVRDAAGKPYWNSSWNVANLRDGRAVCPFGGLGHAVVPVAAWIPSEASASAMARFHAEVTAEGFDGLYVDDFMPAFYPKWAQYAQAISAADGAAELAACARINPDAYGRPGTAGANCSSRFAAAGDGANSSLADLQAQYSAWRPYYTARLRQALGDDKLILANVPVPALSDPSLDGVTIEFEHCKGDEAPHLGSGSSGSALSAACAQTPLAQKAVTEQRGRRTPPVLALWLTHSEVVPAVEQCEQLRAVQRELGDWVREGDDITDCTRETGPASCVRCNSTARVAVGGARN